MTENDCAAAPKALRFDCEHRLRLGKVQVHVTLLSACTVLVADFETHHAE